MINKLSLLFTLFIAIPMFSQAQEIPHNLIPKVQELETRFNSIQKERKAELNQLALETKKLHSKISTASLTFVCTHNSRRSQLAQVWFALAAEWYDLDSMFSYSGGTEATAFNHRMVDALKRFGFDIQKTTDGANPIYQFIPNPSQQQKLTLFSKKYADDFNPQKGFIAVMVCSEADESCPVVNGAAYRQALPYIDPKASDGTSNESVTYDAKVKEIGLEMLYLAYRIKNVLK